MQGKINRMPPIAPDKMTEAQKKAVSEIIAGPRGHLVGPFIPLLRSPEFMGRLQRTGEYLRFNSALEPRQVELAVLITARHWSQQYEWGLHCPIAIEAGVDRPVADAIAEGRRPGRMSEEQEILYDFCTELLHDKCVSDPTYARALAKFGDTGVIEAASIVGYYAMLAAILNTARTPAEPGMPALGPLPR